MKNRGPYQRGAGQTDRENLRRKMEEGRVRGESRQSGGSRSSRPALGALLKSWLLNHLDIGIASLMRLFSMPVQTFMTMFVIAVAICTPMLVYSFSQSIQSSIAKIEATTDLSIYLETDLSQAQIDKAKVTLKGYREIISIEYISAEQGLKDFEDRTGLSEILSKLSDNPIPPVFMVAVQNELGRDSEALNQLAERIGEINNVDQVVFDYAWVERLQALIDFMDRLVIVLGCLLGGGIALILGNTIRLEIENRRDEIIIVKLVGGTNAFVRRPLLYAGFWYGFMGALFGWVFANFGVAALDQPIGDLSKLYVADFGLGFLDLAVLFVVLFLGSILGLMGAWLAVARHLSAVEPR